MSGTEGKVIIVTGASRGIGRAIALALAPGNHLVLVARTRSLLEEVKAGVEERGGTAEVHPIDITDDAAVKELVAGVLESLGKVDVLVNNAGMGIFKRVDEFEMDEVRRMFDLNVFALFSLTREVIPSMIARKRGQVINIASIAGLSGFAGGTAYAASKFAVVGFTESLREDVKHHGIAVSVVCPGSVNTGFGGSAPGSKAGRDFLLEPEDVARTVAYLVSESETANTKLVELKPRKRERYRE